MNTNTKKKKINPWFWIPTLYTAEGVPYVIVMSVATVMYQRLGLSNAEIALYTSWLYLPWVIKPFWSPIVELLKTKRWWILTMQFFIGAALGGLALSLQAPDFIKWSLIMLWLVAFNSATHDIAADGFYLIALNHREQAFYVGIRSTFYRIASIMGQGMLIMFAGMLESRYQPAKAWTIVFTIASVVFILLFFYHLSYLPKVKEQNTQQATSVSLVLKDSFNTFISFFQKPQICVALAFMLLYRLPEAMLVKICQLFLLGDPETGGLGLSTGDVGMVQGTVGVIGLTLGGILGGILVERHGLKRWLWPMVLAITLPDSVYIALAYFQPTDINWIALSVFIEQFGYGFGFTAYMLYLIYFSKGKSSTAHYAFCTGIMALGMMIPGMFAGYLQESVGYLNFFIITTALCAITFYVTSKIKLKDDYYEEVAQK